MRRLLKFIILLTLIPLMFLTSSNVKAEEKHIRVGWFESAFNTSDEFGRLSGYSYEYQQKLSVYTGWTYEYVKGSWSDLFNMLKNGEIDLLSDVSKTPEREEQMLFSKREMGTEDYYVFKSTNNTTISIDDYSTFNGKKVGINEGSIMIDQFNEWKTENHVDAEIVPLKLTAEEAVTKLNRGDIDLYVTMDGTIDIEKAVPLCKIGSSGFYFASRLDDPSIKEKLDYAMDKILTENPYYNQELHLKYFKSSGVNLYLNNAEKEWLNTHKKIRVGYQDNYLAFCAKNSKGELVGALKDYLELASTCFKNAEIEFETICYPTASKALEALKNNEIDCMFPANLTAYDGEKDGLYMTNSIMRTEIVAIVLESDIKSFLKKERIVVAVNAGNPNYDMFLADNFPTWNPVYFDNTNECLKGIANGKADCLLISNYRFNNLAAQCSKYNLAALSTGVGMDYSFAIRREDNVLYDILNKAIDNVPSSSIDASLTYYYTEDAKVGFGDYLTQYIWILILILAVIFIAIFVLVLRSVLADRKFKKHQLLINATEIDYLTGLYSRTFFYEYMNRYYIGNTSKHMDMIKIYIDNFHAVNSLNGKEFGNQVLRELGDEIKKIANDNNGIAGHIDDDCFVIYCKHIDDYFPLYVHLQARVDALYSNSSISIIVGVSPWRENVNPFMQLEEANNACSLASLEHKKHFVVYDNEMIEKEEKNQKLLNSFNDSIEKGEFEIYYQPKYDIKNDNPKFIGAEALLRWNHPEYGLIEAADFISLLERNGKIDVVGKYVRQKIIKQISKWKEKYGIIVPISINVSYIEILNEAFQDTLDIMLEENNLGKESIVIEVTDSTYIDDAKRFIKIIKSMKKTGYKIVIDKFGVGYSSFNMLSQLPIDALKFDSNLIIETNDNEKLIDLIINIAKDLKTSVIAECVESMEQYKMLKEKGCNIAQGFYFSKPLDAIEFEKMLDNM